MDAITPTGSRLTIEVWPGRYSPATGPCIVRTAPAKKRKQSTTPGERSAMLLKLADLIERDAEAYADLEALNCGKPRHLVLSDEIPGVVRDQASNASEAAATA